ncbi:MAG TPA: hypothetical protein VME86_17420 [Acidobacteriaceae bacterium]|nr:hypothetical protein [Acidobacteriaceae bacterium]
MLEEQEFDATLKHDDTLTRVLNNLRDVREYQRKIHGWVRFFGIVTIIGIVVGIIIAIFASVPR